MACTVLTVSSTSVLAPGSEDNTCRLWRPSGECLAVLAHPGCVWAAAWLPPAGTGTPDLVTGCSDSIGRVFSADPARQVGASGLHLLHMPIHSTCPATHLLLRTQQHTSRMVSAAAQSSTWQGAVLLLQHKYPPGCCQPHRMARPRPASSRLWPSTKRLQQQRQRQQPGAAAAVQKVVPLVCRLVLRWRGRR
jgi:hypothetical protein